MISVSYRLHRRAALRLAMGLVAAGPLLMPTGRRPHAQTLDKLSIQTDWRAQAEHGGYYQAIAPVFIARPASSATCARVGPASTSASS